MAIQIVNIRGIVRSSVNLEINSDVEDFIDAPDIESLVENMKLSREEMKKILDDNNIEYKPNIKGDALEKLVKEFI